MPPVSCYRTEEAPHRTIIIPHIMHMAHIIFFMGFSFLRQHRFFFSADSIHPKEDFVNPFLQFSKKKNSKEEMKAVPDGSVDLLFGIGEQDVKTCIGGTVLAAKG